MLRNGLLVRQIRRRLANGSSGGGDHHDLAALEPDARVVNPVRRAF